MHELIEDRSWARVWLELWAGVKSNFALGLVVASNGEAGLPWWWRCVSVIEAWLWWCEVVEMDGRGEAAG